MGWPSACTSPGFAAAEASGATAARSGARAPVRSSPGAAWGCLSASELSVEVAGAAVTSCASGARPGAGAGAPSSPSVSASHVLSAVTLSSGMVTVHPQHMRLRRGPCQASPSRRRLLSRYRRTEALMKGRVELALAAAGQHSAQLLSAPEGTAILFIFVRNTVHTRKCHCVCYKLLLRALFVVFPGAPSFSTPVNSALDR